MSSGHLTMSSIWFTIACFLLVDCFVYPPPFSQGVDEECQLNLSSTQLCCVVDCILNEAAQSIGLIKGGGGGSCDIQREEDDM